MASQFTGALVKRGMDVAIAASNSRNGNEGTEEPEYRMPWWGVMMLGATFMVAFVGMSVVSPGIRELAGHC